MLSGNVLITGGTGSLGTAILERAIKENWPAQFTVMARNETKLSLTKQKFPEVRCEIGDVREVTRLASLFHRQDTIIHAAAIKIVPVAEASPSEAIRTNIYGSMNVARVAIEAGVRKVIGISTDKVCGPTYYGTSKRLMEAVFREANDERTTEFVLCRYGNVLRSNNSIVPLFEKQIAEDKPFTVTDSRMTRFWLSMKMAIDLILDTLHHANPGEIYVPMAPTMKLVDLAHTLDSDRAIEVIGIRAGERLHETLIVKEESMHTIQFLWDNKFIICPPGSERLRYWPDGGHTTMKRMPDQYEYTSEDRTHYLTPEKMLELLAES